MVEAEIGEKTPPPLLIPFAMINALLIFVHLLSMVIAARLLPELDAIVAQPHLISLAGRLYSGWPVQLCWFLSNTVGILLFLVELVVVAYVKFYSPLSNDRIHSGTGTLVVVIVLSLVSVPLLIIFSYSISKKKMRMHEQRLESAQHVLSAMTPDPGSDNEFASVSTQGSFPETKAIEETRV